MLKVRALTALLVAVAWAGAGPRGQSSAIPIGDWPQYGRDAQRTGWSPLQVDPPYCYAWKWYEAPIASRAQPVVAAGRLFVGSMDGEVFARDARTGAPLWTGRTGGPIRHSLAVAGDLVIGSSHDGETYAWRAATGEQVWRTRTSWSATAPLVDAERGRVYVASTEGSLFALDVSTGSVAWRYEAGAPILTSPTLSTDGSLVLLGSERVDALAVDAATGQHRWATPLQGQSLSDRAPVVAGTTVFYRAQPLDFFHRLLHEGDAVMDGAGPVHPDWATDWALIKPRLLAHLQGAPHKQTFFALDVASGVPRGLAPVLYTHGNNDTPASPLVRGREVFLPYRARHGIQTDSQTAVHVTTKYDGELGRLDLDTLDISGVRAAASPAFNYQFRLTSDEPAALTMAGDVLLVDNWERLGGIDLRTGQLLFLGSVSNNWPECYVQCGIESPAPFFPLSGGPAYPFPSPRVTEGHQRAGAVVAADAIYWRVVEGGIAAFVHAPGTSCPAPRVWAGQSATPTPPQGLRTMASGGPDRRLEDYVWQDLHVAAASPAPELVERVRNEVRAIVSAGDHLMPFYVERGFTHSALWPRRTPNPPGPPLANHQGQGNFYWHDPADLIYTLALAYPYLDAPLQQQARAYVEAERTRYPPLANLPWDGQPWLKRGVARERHEVPFRDAVSSWPPPGADLNALTAIWLWAKHTGDWSYASATWPQMKAFFESRAGTLDHYADLGGVIAYARLAHRFGDVDAERTAVSAATDLMTRGRDFDSFRSRAEAQYLDARARATGWYAPALFGLTPEVGLYLREQVPAASLYLQRRVTGNGLRWWFLTRAGAHAEVGETSFVAPMAGWSYFMAQAYLTGAPALELARWLDRPWARGDLFSIQRIVATLQARQ